MSQSGSNHLSDQPVLRPLAEKTDRREWFDERFALLAPTESKPRDNLSLACYLDAWPCQDP